MGRRARPFRSNQIARWLLPAVVFAFGLGEQRELAAASVSSTGAFDADDHSQYCKCRNCRRESCCCGPHRAKAVGTGAVPAAESIRMGGGLCLRAAPCGDSGLPTAPVAGPSGKMAALANCGHPVPVAGGRLAPPDTGCILPSQRPSRLDRPPERLILA
jgi:hypothetical protein